jgi:hypothetical protein
MLDGANFFGFTPLAGGADTFVLNFAGSDVEPTLPGLQATLDAASGRTDIRLRELTWGTVWRANVRLAQRFCVGRVFLAGDAAHVHPPTGGQGLNTGVQDAYNLGWKLATVIAGGHDELLDSYQAERLPVASRVLGISTEQLDKTLRGSADAMERGEQFRQLDLSYRGGPLTLDDGSSALLAAGDRAPDAPCLDRRCVHSHQIGTDIVDAHRHIQQAYDVKDGAAVLIRPDGYIGAITTQPAALADYGNRVLAD